MLEFLHYGFMQRALIAGIAVSLVAPLLGIFMTVRRQSLIADTLAHASLAGVAVGIAFNLEPLLAAAVSAVFAGLLIERLRAGGGLSSESTLALVLSGSLALAVVLMSAVGKFNAGVLGYLFGGITTVSVSDVRMIVITAIVVILLITIFFRQLFLLAFDEEIAGAQGLKTAFLNILLAVATAAVVAVGMRVVGVLLIGALMVIPVLAATQLGRGFKTTTAVSLLISFLCVTGGLVISYYFDLASGGTIVLLAIAAFLLTTFYKTMRG
jgi:zinc transport system permease protein